MSSPYSNNAVRAGLCACVLLAIAACSSAPTTPDDDRAPVSADRSAGGDTLQGANASGGAGGAQSGSSAPGVVPQRAATDFERAVGLMRAGNTTAAEREFKQLSLD